MVKDKSTQENNDVHNPPPIQISLKGVIIGALVGEVAVFILTLIFIIFISTLVAFNLLNSLNVPPLVIMDILAAGMPVLGMAITYIGAAAITEGDKKSKTYTGILGIILYVILYGILSSSGYFPYPFYYPFSF